MVLWRRKWLPTLVFLPGESHGQRSLAGYSPWGLKESDMSDWHLTFHARCMLSFWRNCQTDFQNGCIFFSHCHQQCMRVSIAPHSHQHLVNHLKFSHPVVIFACFDAQQFSYIMASLLFFLSFLVLLFMWLWEVLVVACRIFSCGLQTLSCGKWTLSFSMWDLVP